MWNKITSTRGRTTITISNRIILLRSIKNARSAKISHHQASGSRIFSRKTTLILSRQVWRLMRVSCLASPYLEDTTYASQNLSSNLRTSSSKRFRRKTLRRRSWACSSATQWSADATSWLSRLPICAFSNSCATSLTIVWMESELVNARLMKTTHVTRH